MTDEGNNTKVTNKNNEEETIESDIEHDEDAYTDDKSSVTTDDEFYNELMDAPSEAEDHLIPDKCTDEIAGIEHLTSCLNRRYNSCPVVFPGVLKDALKEAFVSKEIKERRPLLIYVNNDKSLYSNLFCKQLLCHDKIIDFLLNNYVLWAWDVTFQSNGEKLNEMYKATFPQGNVEQKIGTNSIDQYPLLIGVRHDRNSEYLFTRLIDGTDKRPVVDEFLARLIQFKDLFDLGEQDFEKAKKQTEEQMMSTLLRAHGFHHRPTHSDNHDFRRSASMLSPIGYNINPLKPSRLSRNNDDEFFFNNQLNFSNTFTRLSINPDDSDNEDDDDDDQTPTVERSLPRFPK